MDSNPVHAHPANQREKPKFNNKGQHRHWVSTFNNCTEDDCTQMKSAFEKDQLLPLESRMIVSAIVAREVGESGTPHSQGHFHFKKPAVNKDALNF